MEIKVNLRSSNQPLSVDPGPLGSYNMVAAPSVCYSDHSVPGTVESPPASMAWCAVHFIRRYCQTLDIPAENIRLLQNDIRGLDGGKKQVFNIQIALPHDLSEQSRRDIVHALNYGTAKNSVPQDAEWMIELVDYSDKDAEQWLKNLSATKAITSVPDKDLPLEQSIANMLNKLTVLGINIEIICWRNPVTDFWLLHIRDTDSVIHFSNGKGLGKRRALASALGEFIERLEYNFYYNGLFLGEEIANADFIHYPDERWFKPGPNDELPKEILDDYCLDIYNPDGELCSSHLYDTGSGNIERGICSLPYVRRSDGAVVYFPVNLIENLFLSNGMSVGNSLAEAQIQCLAEIFSRAVKRDILQQEIVLPDVPPAILEKYPDIVAAIKSLEAQGFVLLVKDASLGGRFPVMCIALMNPRTGGVFASFGAHPGFDIALERSLSGLLQEFSFADFEELPAPTFESTVLQSPDNFIKHFIDSSGLLSWHFFSTKADFDFVEWDFSAHHEKSSETVTSDLFAILERLGLESYMSASCDSGIYACRILVPDYSEIYPTEDLIWNNNNKALYFREDILNLHRLDDEQLEDLVGRLEESGLDGDASIATLIGIEFDDNSVWSQLTVTELKMLIYLALGYLQETKLLADALLQSNTHGVERMLFFQALDVMLEVVLEVVSDDDLDAEDYITNFRRIYGVDRMDAVIDSINGSVRFFGLTPVNMQLEGLDKHMRLIARYKKLHAARAVTKPAINSGR